LLIPFLRVLTKFQAFALIKAYFISSSEAFGLLTNKLFFIESLSSTGSCPT